jgi:hypothetical protein
MQKPPWPSKSDLQLLVEKAEGSFIFAVTLMKFISEGDGHPSKKLQAALTAEAGLDALYTQVLQDFTHDANFDHVFGTVMLLSSHVPITSLACLLQLQADEEIVQTLLGVQSILMIPGNNDQPIQAFHTSLRDFLVSPQRSCQLFINPSIHHLSIAIDCLTVIISPLAEDGIFYRGGREYASLNWCYHLHQISIYEEDIISVLLSEESLIGLLKCFESKHFDYWVNTLLKNGYGSTMDTLDLVVSVIEVSDFLGGSKTLDSLTNIFQATTQFLKGSAASLARY